MEPVVDGANKLSKKSILTVNKKCFGIPLDQEQITMPNGIKNVNGFQSSLLDSICWESLVAGSDGWHTSTAFPFKGNNIESLIEESEMVTVEAFEDYMVDVETVPENTYEKIYDSDKLKSWINANSCAVASGNYQLIKAHSGVKAILMDSGRILQLAEFKPWIGKIWDGRTEIYSSRLEKNFCVIRSVSEFTIKAPKKSKSKRTRRDEVALHIDNYFEQCHRSGHEPNLNECYHFLRNQPEIDSRIGGTLMWETLSGGTRELSKKNLSGRFNRRLKRP